VVALDLGVEVREGVGHHPDEVRVLVLGVGHEQVHRGVEVRGDRSHVGGGAGVDPSGRTGQGEEVGADALVDVAVGVDGDELVGAGGDGVDDGHG